MSKLGKVAPGVIAALLLVSQEATSVGKPKLDKTPQEIVEENAWRCRSKLEDGELERMEDRLIHREIPGLSSGVLFPGQDYICVLIRFDVSDTGEPINFETVYYWPTSRYVRAGYQTLIEYRFKPAERSKVDGPFYEVFEMTWSKEPELDISKLPTKGGGD